MVTSTTEASVDTQDIVSWRESVFDAESLPEVPLPPGNTLLPEVVLLSGGQDSTTVAMLVAWLMQQRLATGCYNQSRAGSGSLYLLSFDYGQRHASPELRAATEVGRWITAKHDLVQVHHHLLDIKDAMSVIGEACGSALLNRGLPISQQEIDRLPSSFVPGRNMIFLSFAYAFAASISASRVWTGVCETDYSGYPDCRQVFINSMNTTGALSVDSKEYRPTPRIAAPLMRLSKADTFALADAIPHALRAVLDYSHTCYEGMQTANAWGRGCGQCPACLLRMQGYKTWLRDAQGDSSAYEQRRYDVLSCALDV